MPGDRNRHIRWNQKPFQGFHFPQDILGHRDGVGSRALADGQRHGRLLSQRVHIRGGRPRAVEHIVRGFLGPIHNLGYFTQINGPTRRHAHHHIADVLDILKKRAGLQHQ